LGCKTEDGKPLGLLVIQDDAGAKDSTNMVVVAVEDADLIHIKEALVRLRQRVQQREQTPGSLVVVYEDKVAAAGVEDEPARFHREGAPLEVGEW
jgi:hypothetical protein